MFKLSCIWLIEYFLFLALLSILVDVFGRLLFKSQKEISRNSKLNESPLNIQTKLSGGISRSNEVSGSQISN